MVTKQATVPLHTANGAHQTNPPYPTSPADLSRIPTAGSSVYTPDTSSAPAFNLVDSSKAPTRRRDSDVSSHGTWDTDDEDDKQEEAVEIPKPLRIIPSKQDLSQPKKEQQEDIPAILKPGPAQTPADSSMNQYQALPNPWADDSRRLSPQATGSSQNSNNPYLKARPAVDSSAQPWSNQAPPPAPQAPSVPVTSQQTHPSSLQPPSAPALPQQPHVLPLPPPPQAPPPPPPVELPTESTPSDELSKLSLYTSTPKPDSKSIQRKPITPLQPSPATFSQPQLDPQSNPWQQQSSITAQQKWDDSDYPPPPSGPRPDKQGLLIDHVDTPSASTTSAHQAPSARIEHSSPSARVTSPTTNDRNDSPGMIERKRSEHYHIKHINWQSTSDPSSITRSPILTQNANGPCPLLALVNALVLTTPPDANTALVETLRTREQVSLGLLLDAVFDELMSGRRGDSAATLPDVSDLYSFLLALHTGMNVNPRFVSKAMGGFEQTREMRLYSTFSIPLIHGWTAIPGSAAYQAFERRAQSFEDAQNIQFAEMELEDKLHATELSEEEQRILQDIQTIKRFLITWPTQLTDHGLQMMSSSLRAGQFAILFRNDHFSTIYKEPTHGALMTLVTDAGYSSHDEIVWESLVDVNGAASELFSGDFRAVSHDQDVGLNQQSPAGRESSQAAQSRSRYRNQRHNSSRQSAASETPPPPLPGPRPTVTTIKSSEQEDHDFALALQLQEEEEAQQRRQQEQRRREQELSEQFLSGQNEGRPPAIPARRGGSRQSTSVRPAVNRPAETLDPDAPPTYEQSASDRPYREGQSAPLNAYDALRRQQEQQSAYAAQSGSPTHGRRPSSNNQRFGSRTSQLGMPGDFDGTAGRRPGQAATAQEAEERCVIM